MNDSVDTQPQSANYIDWLKAHPVVLVVGVVLVVAIGSFLFNNVQQSNSYETEFQDNRDQESYELFQKNMEETVQKLEQEFNTNGR